MAPIEKKIYFHVVDAFLRRTHFYFSFKVDGGSKLSVKASWSQRLPYQDDQFWLSVPFSFPVYVTPPGKHSMREKILLNINSGIGREILWKTATHPLKVSLYYPKLQNISYHTLHNMIIWIFQELSCQVGKLGFLYEAEVCSWSQADFEFSYAVSHTNVKKFLQLVSILDTSPPT